ncbi:hypothetical protein SKAU_G00251390 [Synaphobranchus kaupii]|uniref:Uncharacterized protein n=1 Tax=Synaphobranchus kaupii TaxID=118154 RepID=A0A9Q1F2W9_SYNKA|nr:hypothetical protein SKAU_G00251390 [Synaphobranchus kaupii]
MSRHIFGDAHTHLRSSAAGTFGGPLVRAQSPVPASPGGGSPVSRDPEGCRRDSAPPKFNDVSHQFRSISAPRCTRKGTGRECDSDCLGCTSGSCQGEGSGFACLSPRRASPARSRWIMSARPRGERNTAAARIAEMPLRFNGRLAGAPPPVPETQALAAGTVPSLRRGRLQPPHLFGTSRFSITSPLLRSFLVSQ